MNRKLFIFYTQAALRKNQIKKSFSFLLYMTVLIFFHPVRELNAQVPFTSKDAGSEYLRGMELYSKEKYPAAIRLLDSFVKNGDKSDMLKVSDAQYYSSLAALKVFNPDAEYRMMTYIYTHPESPRINESRLELGNYFYQNKNYRKAAEYYETVNRQDLKSEKLAEYFFRYGYSLYIKGDQARALLMFSEIKDIDTDYTPPAVYYYSQIAYEQKMYQTALEGFMRLKDDETFGPIVPFYIVQILYLQKDYDSILTMAPELLKSAGKTRSIELYRFIGDAYYSKGNYKEALPYLEKYAEGAKSSSREDKYELGYCYYKAGNTDKAIKTLQEAGTKNDLLGQNIWDILGDCYMKKGDKNRARQAFGQASALDFDKTIKEEALYNYAKLTYETAYAPFGEAIAAFEKYIDLYPGSKRIQEVYEYLVGTLMQIKNYKAALTALDKLGSKDSRLEEAYQKAAFFRGLELFKNLEFGPSIDMFDKSLKYEKYNHQIRARTIYWRAEANYRLGNYDLAKADYQQFMGIPGSSSLGEYKMVRYNLGYTFFNQKDYPAALTNFKSFESAGSSTKPEILTDVRDRIADCHYIATNYSAAIEYYDKVIQAGDLDADYAMFQKGFSLGLMNNSKGKIDVLTSLMSKYPSSSYVPNALFERGRAYLVLEDFKKGEADFNKIISDYQSSAFVPRSIVQLGLLYYNLGDNEKAIAQYKQVIEKYKSTPEARDAMTGLKNAYVDMNDVDTYFAYLKTLDGYGDINLSQKDSLLYTSGENLFMSGKYDKATAVLNNYLAEFPNGSFRQNAEYYLAESLMTAGKSDEALKYYIDVTGQPNNQFLEKSLISAATILYGKEDYSGAFDYYKKLEAVSSNDANKMAALKGELRTSYQEGDAQNTISAAGKILNTRNVPEELVREATFMSAKANYSLNNFDEALASFRKVGTEVTSIEGAESKYRVAELLDKKDKTAEAEKTITEFIDLKTPHQYWMARVFLLLADISIKKGDKLQARATLQTLKDYYTVENDGILDEVKEKLNSIDEKKTETDTNEKVQSNTQQ
jgi:TolA-binding protein